MRKFHEGQIIRLAKFSSPNYQEIGDQRNDLETVKEIIAINAAVPEPIEAKALTSEDAQRENVGSPPRRGPGRPRKVDLSADVVIPEPAQDADSAS